MTRGRRLTHFMPCCTSTQPSSDPRLFCFCSVWPFGEAVLWKSLQKCSSPPIRVSWGGADTWLLLDAYLEVLPTSWRPRTHRREWVTSLEGCLGSPPGPAASWNQHPISTNRTDRSHIVWPLTQQNHHKKRDINPSCEIRFSFYLTVGAFKGNLSSFLS